MLDGAADGTPPLRDRAEYRDWVKICSQEYLRLKHDAEKGKKSFLNAYGATNEAEFFAVEPNNLINPIDDQTHARPLPVIKEYYRQDPSLRLGQNSCLAEKNG